jgi:ribosomal protein S18 acetylase RimI-like enzyme
MEIRLYEPNERESLKEFLSSYYHPHMQGEKRLMDFERKELLNQLSNCLIAKDSGKIVGVINFEKRQFDTDILGVSSGAITLFYCLNGQKELLNEAINWFKSEEVKFVTIRIDSNNTELVKECRTVGLNPIEVLYTFKKDFRERGPIPEPRVLVRSFRKEDVQQIENIAEYAFNNDRYNQDSNLSPEKCRMQKKMWVRNCCNGRALDVLVAEVNGEVAGFVTCSVKNSIGTIELIAIAEKYRGRGIGVDLLYSAQKWFSDKCEVLFVGTETINVPAVKMYLKAGFKIESALTTLHGWY